jgi:replicative DNA helicase
MTSGLKPSQLVIIAARPSMGKSAFATNIAEHACLADKVPTALFSLEMGAADLMERVLCTQAGVKLQRIRDGFMSKTDMQNLGAQTRRNQPSPACISTRRPPSASPPSGREPAAPWPNTASSSSSSITCSS